MFKGSGCAKCPVNQWDCDAQYRGSRCAVLREKANADYDPQTNSDRIREMADDGLAKEISKLVCAGYKETQILEWLQSTEEI